jgi:SnoaL-like domain
VTIEVERSLEQRIDQIESRTAIAELVAGYCEGVDRRDDARFLSLWHEDAAYLIGGRGDFYGAEGLKEALVLVRPAWKATYHWTTNLTVKFESPDRATGRSDVFAMCVYPDDQVSFIGGTYADEFERREGEWKFAKRVVDLRLVSAPVDIGLPPPR